MFFIYIYHIYNITKDGLGLKVSVLAKGQEKVMNLIILSEIGTEMKIRYLIGDFDFDNDDDVIDDDDDEKVVEKDFEDW